MNFIAWIALVLGLLAHVRMEFMRRRIAREFRDRDVQCQRDLLSIAERIEPHGPSSDGLPPKVSEKFRRRG